MVKQSVLQVRLDDFELFIKYIHTYLKQQG